jgi:hypothetical protein
LGHVNPKPACALHADRCGNAQAGYVFYIGNMSIEDITFLLVKKPQIFTNKYLHPTPLMDRERVASDMR